MTEHLRLNKVVDVMMSRSVIEVKNYITDFLFRGKRFSGKIYGKDRMFKVPKRYHSVVVDYLKGVISAMCVQSYDHAISSSMIKYTMEHEIDTEMIEEDDYLFEEAGFRIAYTMANMYVSVCNAVEVYETVRVRDIVNTRCRNATLDILYVLFSRHDKKDVNCYLSDDNLMWGDYVRVSDIEFPRVYRGRDGVKFSIYDYKPKAENNAVVVSQYAFFGASRLGCGYASIHVLPVVEKPCVTPTEEVSVDVDEIAGIYGDLKQVLENASCGTVIITDDLLRLDLEEYPNVRYGSIDSISGHDKMIIVYHSLHTALLDDLLRHLSDHKYKVTVYLIESCISERYKYSRGTLRKELDHVFLRKDVMKRDRSRIVLKDIIMWCADNDIRLHGREFFKYHDYYDGWIYWFKPRGDNYKLCDGTCETLVSDPIFQKRVRGLFSWVRSRYGISCDEWNYMTSPISGNSSYASFIMSVEKALTKEFNSDVEYGLSPVSPNSGSIPAEEG